ncbi:hypothetical protein MaudCBS49596_000711 [Microsporum audouinii]
MRTTLLTIIFSAFLASALAARYSITTPEGLFVTNGGYMVEVTEPSNYNLWSIDQLSQNLQKNWHVIHYFGNGYIRFSDFVDGTIATVGYDAVIYTFEKDGEYSYIIPIEANQSGNRLAWTVEEQSANDKNLRVKLRPYMRTPNQRFQLNVVD